MADANLARAEGMEPLGYVKAYAYAALDPSRMGLGPVFAIDQILRTTIANPIGPEFMAPPARNTVAA